MRFLLGRRCAPRQGPRCPPSRMNWTSSTLPTREARRGRSTCQCMRKVPAGKHDLVRVRAVWSDEKWCQIWRGFATRALSCSARTSSPARSTSATFAPHLCTGNVRCSLNQSSPKRFPSTSRTVVLSSAVAYALFHSSKATHSSWVRQASSKVCRLSRMALCGMPARGTGPSLTT